MGVLKDGEKGYLCKSVWERIFYIYSEIEEGIAVKMLDPPEWHLMKIAFLQ
jgi:hypothetical protein